MIASAKWHTSTSVQIFWNVCKAHLLLRLSSENGFEGRLTLDLPRSTFQDVGDATGEGDTSPSSFDSRSRLLDLDSRGGERLGDFAGRDMVRQREEWACV